MNEQQIKSNSEIRKEELKNERSARRWQYTAYGARKIVKWAAIGAAGAFIYSKITSDNDEVTEEDA